jgi:hypothetical protein
LERSLKELHKEECEYFLLTEDHTWLFSVML